MKSGGAKGHYYTPSLDYILAYAKNINVLPYFRAVMTQKQIKTFYKFTQQEGSRKGELYGEERLFKSSLEARANQRYYNVQMEHLQSLLGIVFLTNLKKD